MIADLGDLIGAIGPRLRDLRVARDLTLATVAEQSGLSISTLPSGNR